MLGHKIAVSEFGSDNVLMIKLTWKQEKKGITTDSLKLISELMLAT